MIYFYCYVGLGAAISLLVVVDDYLKKKSIPASIRNPFETLFPKRKKLSYRLLHNIVIPALTVIAIIVIWPVALYRLIQGLFNKQDIADFTEPPSFAIEREHLQEQLTVDEIEKREFVIDPLKAVPELPFGHLNAAWHKFLKNRTENTELWSFSALWSTAWSGAELRLGYVIVENGAPGPYFLTVRKALPKEAKIN